MFGTFDVVLLDFRLFRLTAVARTAFAAACAWRIANSAESELLAETKELLEELWLRRDGPPEQVRDLAERALELSDKGDENDDPLVSDAAAAAHFACLCLMMHDPVRNARWAAERVINTIDTFLNETEFAELSFEEVDEGNLIWRHRLMRTELERQARDLALLRSETNSIAVVNAAERESALG